MPELSIFEEQPVNELIGRDPSWIIRCGISMVFVVMIILLLISWFIRYPDTIHNEITLTAMQPPVNIISKVDGRITELLVKDGDFIQKNKSLILLENNVDFEQLLNLERILFDFKVQDYDSSKSIFGKTDIDNLGELQPEFNNFFIALEEFQSFNSSEKLSAQIKSINVINTQYSNLLDKLSIKQDVMKNKLELESQLLNVNKKLNIQGLMANTELIPFQARYLDKKLALGDIDIQFELYQIMLKELQQKLELSKIDHSDRQQALKTAMFNKYFSLVNSIFEWKKKYLMKAPVSGTISFSKFWSENQYVQSGDELMSIVVDSKKVIGKMKVSQLGAGKILVGQNVEFELSSYPAFEFGKLTGTVKSISLVPGIEGYVVDISLPNNLITSYGYQVIYTPNLKGKAKIITQKKRLLERFLGKIIYTIDKI